MQGTSFVVNAVSGDFYLWKTFVTDDENRIRRFWLQRNGIDCISQITEAEYWDLEELCHKHKVVFMGAVR